MIKNIIFDLGGVLIDWNPDYVYEAHFKNKHMVAAFYKETGILELNNQLDRGLCFTTELQKLVQKFPHHAKPIWFWRDHWPNMLRGEITESVAILKNLYQKNYTLYGLTNWSAETFPYAIKNYDFLKYFKDIVVSGKEQFIKPEAEIYKILLARNKIIAQECVFIDDKLENLQAAELLGIKIIHFLNPKKLAEDLDSILLLTTE